MEFKAASILSNWALGYVLLEGPLLIICPSQVYIHQTKQNQLA